MEIERKFLLKELPSELFSYPHYEIEQAFVTTNPVIRIRKKSLAGAGDGARQVYVLTIKGDGMLARNEYELSISEEGYQNLLAKADGNLIEKTRYKIPVVGDLILELDIFHGLYEGLVIGEIEFPNEEVANNYPLPDFVKGEVTFDTRFHNSTLSGMSKEEIAELIQSIS